MKRVGGKLYVFCVALLLSGHIGVAFAQSSKKTPTPTATKTPKPKIVKSREVACPAVIADKSQAVLFKRSAKATKNRFACYKTAKDAQAEGFKTLRAAQQGNYSGWFRMRLKLVKDTCSGIPHSDGPALFVQIKQNDSEVFAEFCPTLGKFSGVSAPNGFTVSSLDEGGHLASLSVCGEGNVRDHQFFEFSEVIGGSAAYNVRYSIVRRCLDASAPVESCVREYTGIAFHETHTLWPPVADKIDEMPNGCSMALTRCSICHPELTNLLPPSPAK